MIVVTCRSPGYGMILVSESTSGVMHSAEGSTQATPTQSTGQRERAEDKKSAKHAPTLPEDIGKQAAVYLIEEIVKVSSHFLLDRHAVTINVVSREDVLTVDVKLFPSFLWLLDKRTFLRYS